MKAKLSLNIDLSNPVHLSIMTALLAECGKANIDCTTTPIEEKVTKVAATTTKTPAKAEKKSTVKTDEEPKSFATDYAITLEKDGIHIDAKGREGRKSLKIAASKLYNAGCKRGENYNYYMPGKGGKISATATKKVFEQFEGGKIHIADEDYKRS